jgi:pilus assembly protein CpaB
VRNRKAIVMIVFSALMGLAAMLIAAKWLGQKALLATSQVVVAAKDIQLGTALSPDMLKAVDWPSGALPDGAITDLKMLETRVVRTAVQRGEPILEKKLAPQGTKGGLSSVISEGKRAVTVRVNEVVGVAGFALPGNLVDVMVNIKDNQDRSVSKIVLEQILVLAVAQEANRDETKPKVVSAVTLELTPVQAERLDLARSVGNLSLVLRNQLDKNVVQTTGVRTVDLLDQRPAERPALQPAFAAKPAKLAPRRPAAPPAAPAATRKPTLEVIKGTNKSTVEY